MSGVGGSFWVYRRFLRGKIMNTYEVLEGFQKIKLTEDEEANMPISAERRGNSLEECSLSLFGRLLTGKPFNRRAARDTLKTVWRMGPDFSIQEVGEDILQFKFPNEFQLKWVLDNGPWSFENNLLLLRRWERGLSTKKLCFTHAPFWIQVWGLPFDLVSEQVGEDIGNRMGRYIAGDGRKGAMDQARYLRIRVEIPVEKPLHRGGIVTSPEGKRFWVDYRYERLSNFYFVCRRMGHDKRVCPYRQAGKGEETPQYGEWLKATFNGVLVKPGLIGREKSSGDSQKATTSEGVQTTPMVVDSERSKIDEGGVTSKQSSDKEVGGEVTIKAFNEGEKGVLVVMEGHLKALIA